MAPSSSTSAVEVELSLPEARRLIEQLRAQLAEAQAARAGLQRSLELIEPPMQSLGDSVQFLSSAFEELAPLFYGYRQALTSLRSTHTPAAAQLADLKELEAACDFEFLAHELPEAFARSLEGTERIADILRTMRELARR